MLVYRLCNEIEAQRLLNGETFQNIGKHFKKRKKANNFDYNENETYLHFFRKFDNIFYLKVREGKCICTYDIPDEILKVSEGTGRYHNYMFPDMIDDVPEYAINCNMLNYDYLIKIDKFIVYANHEDYFEDITLSNVLETIYQNNAYEQQSIKNRS